MMAVQIGRISCLLDSIKKQNQKIGGLPDLHSQHTNTSGQLSIVVSQLPLDSILQDLTWSLNRSSHVFLRKSSVEAVHILSLLLTKL